MGDKIMKTIYDMNIYIKKNELKKRGGRERKEKEKERANGTRGK